MTDVDLPATEIWEQFDNVLHLLGIHCGMPKGAGSAHITTGFRSLADILENLNPKTADQKSLDEIIDENGEVWKIHRVWFAKQPWRLWHGRVVILKNELTGKCRKAFLPHKPHLRRYNKLAATLTMRSNYSSAKAERKAQNRLFQALSETQRDSYLLADSLLEVGRSGVVYILRKNRPTLAVRINSDETENVLCALCLHPTGFYTDTWAGVMPPSDEVLAHLLMIRSSEHFFWRKANHIPLHEETSGV